MHSLGSDEPIGASQSQHSTALDQAVEAKLEEQCQVFGLSTGIGGEPSMEVQTAGHGEEEGEVVGK